VVRAVLFDLDDTLFDHRHCARSALGALHAAHPAFQSHPFDDFERLHVRLLEELHRRVAVGELPLDVARQERFRRLFEAMGAAADDDTVAHAAATYRDGYRRLRQPVTGAAALLAAVSTHAAIGIVSNNLLEEQADKLRYCGLDRYVDVLVVSEETGISKPDPRIFDIALERLEVTADDAVMVGDSWTADVAGARAAGIRAIWFNPTRAPKPEPDDAVQELWSLEPVERVVPVILRADS
jgi:YjjG family noncanonical pyrimidine nucleotidase